VYPAAIEDHFNGRSSYGQIIKSFGQSGDQNHRYSPAGLSGARRVGLWGFPRARYISTSHVERNNLTIRMHVRRFTRLTNAFSKKLENLRAAVALHFAHYNLCRRHSALDLTPAVAAGIESEAWKVERLLPEWG
jgi:ABC-type histidine transport system ATPase subunit